MADLSITAANVKPTANTEYMPTLLSAAAIVAGEMVYTDSNNQYNKATTDVALANVASIPTGMALQSVAQGQPLTAGRGQITIGSGLTAGTEYNLSANAGKITTDAIPTGDNVVTVGVLMSATDINIQPKNWNVLKA